MNPIDLTTLIPRCHEASKANGWWEPRPNAGQALMLVVSELSEALEADRSKAPKIGLQGYLTEAARLKADGWESLCNGHPDFHKVEFEQMVKDTVGDELADAYIRLCDFAGGFELDMALIGIQKCDAEHWAIATDNFGDALLTCVDAVMVMHKVRLRTGFAPGHMEGPLSDALTWIEVLARQQGIDLATHIDLKLQYNTTRGQKHGGKAY